MFADRFANKEHVIEVSCLVFPVVAQADLPGGSKKRLVVSISAKP
jgi:hypothetical protein